MHVVGVLEQFQSEVYRKGVLQEKEVKIAQKQQNTLLRILTPGYLNTTTTYTV